MDERGRSRGPEESQRPVMRVCVCVGRGDMLSAAGSGTSLHPLSLAEWIHQF